MGVRREEDARRASRRLPEEDAGRDEHEPAAREGGAAGGEGSSEGAHGTSAGGSRTRTRWSRSPTTSAVVRRAICVSPVGMRRWASTGTATCWTSSGRTWSRPARAACAREARRRWRLARGEAPSRRAELDRVAWVRSTMYCLTAGGGVDLADGVDHRGHRRGVGDGLEGLERRGAAVEVEHVELGARRRVAHRDAGHEPVALRLGEGVGALHLDGVLGGHDDERLGSV